MNTVQVVTSTADQMAGDAVVALYFEDQRPLDGPAALLDWRLDGQLTRLLLDGRLRGHAGEHVMIQANHKIAADWILFVGGGKWQGLSRETHAALVRHILAVVEQAGLKDVALAFCPHSEVDCQVIGAQVDEVLATLSGRIASCRYACSDELLAV